jgi:hypothetical protein
MPDNNNNNDNNDNNNNNNKSHDKNQISADDLAAVTETTLVADYDSDPHPLMGEKTSVADSGGPVPPPINMAEIHSSNPDKSLGHDHNDDPLPLGLRLASMAQSGQDDVYGDLSELSNMGLDDESGNEHYTDDKAKEEEEVEIAPLPGDGDNMSEMDESLASWNSVEAREAAIRDGFIAFMIGYVQGHLFQKFMGWVKLCWGWFLKKIGHGKEGDDDAGVDLAQEAIEAADPGATNLVGGGMAGPPPGTADMATSASQSAASAGATGASAAAGAAAGSAAMGMAAAVASAGVAGQVGAAIGVAAVTAAAISSGLNVATNTTTSGVPALFVDNFVPPICSTDSLLKEGYVELHIAGLAPTVLPDQKQVLELLFR